MFNGYVDESYRDKSTTIYPTENAISKSLLKALFVRNAPFNKGVFKLVLIKSGY